MFSFLKSLFNPSSQDLSAEELYQKAMEAFLSEGIYEAAIPWLEKVLEVDENHVEGRKDLGVYLIRCRQVEEGVSQLQSLVERFPNEPAGYRALGNYFYLQASNHEEAIPHYLKALELDPQSSALYFALMSCYSMLGRPGEAKEAIEKYLEFFPGDPEGLAMLGELKSQLSEGGGDDGLEELERSLEIDPESRVVPSQLVEEYTRRGELEKIEEMLQTYPDLQDQYLLQFTLSESFQSFEKREKAIECILRFLEKYEYFFANESMEANQANQPLFEMGINQLKSLEGDPELIQRFENALAKGLE